MARTNDGFDLQLAEKVDARKKSTLRSWVAQRFSAAITASF
jgi:hypothetical protein